MTPIGDADSSDTSLSDRMDEWISRQHTLLVEKDPDITDYPINSYVLFTPPSGRNNKPLPKHKGPYQVLGRRQSVYIIENLVRGKQIKTHVHNSVYGF